MIHLLSEYGCDAELLLQIFARSGYRWYRVLAGAKACTVYIGSHAAAFASRLVHPRPSKCAAEDLSRIHQVRCKPPTNGRRMQSTRTVITTPGDRTTSTSSMVAMTNRPMKGMA